MHGSTGQVNPKNEERLPNRGAIGVGHMLPSEDHAESHGRPPLSVPFPLQLSEEGILPRPGREDVARENPASNGKPVTAPVRPGERG